jgi:hypothetical protein
MVQSVTIVLDGVVSQRSYTQQLLAPTYSASAMDRATEFCFLEDQHTRDLPKNWQVLDVLFLSTLHPA